MECRLGLQLATQKCIILILSACLVNSLAHHPAFSQSLNEGAAPPANCLKQTCGNVKVSYPFKLRSEAACPSFSSFFILDCQAGSELYLLSNVTLNSAEVQMRVLQIQSDSLIVDATGLSSVMKTSENGTCAAGDTSILILPAFPGPFFVSDDNLFGSFGCTMGIVIGAQVLTNSSSTSDLIPSDVELGGCSAICPGDQMNSECEGQTCCISHMANDTSFRGVVNSVYPSSFITDINAFNSTPCNKSYATLFYPSYTDFSKQSYGLKLKWALPSNQSIMDLKQSSNFACSNHSNITIVQEVPGYRCSCQLGFDGDGYLQGSGCSDINKCANASLNDCIVGKSTCHNNVDGSYSCKCNSRIHVGNGLRNGSGCTFSPTLRNVLAIVGAIMFLGLLIGGLVIFAIYWRQKTKRKYFLLNGGIQLQDIMTKAGGGKWDNKLFTTEELKVATENYADHMKLGMGGFGTVYKGVLKDGRLVAIKKENRGGGGGGGGNEQFLNEMQILMQINHRNIVRLLGCCMETEVPLLVYEYVANGNVRENLDQGGAGVLGWNQRLKVARQTVEALAYLHAAASPPILHGDVKSANVLIDDHLNAKVADFGVSRLIPDGVQHVSQAVQGTIGYLDPEYFQTLQLTDKSDVYSLGVMLVELITGLKPIDSRNREPRFANLALFFIDHMKETRGEELIDPCLFEEPSTLSSERSHNTIMVRSSIMAVAALAHRCLALRGDERPSMSLLADELRHITRSLEDFSTEINVKEKYPLMPLKSNHANKHYETGAVVSQDAEFFVELASNANTMSISNLHLDMPR